MKLETPTVVSPKMTTMHPISFCLLMETLRIANVKTYVAIRVPPLNIWYTELGIKFNAV
jgi:hypothetical protein